MILARNSITLHHLRDITTVVWYYRLQASTASPPAKPTTETPSGWSTTEPSYTEGSTNSLYVVQKTTFSDGTFEYSDVSLSTSYEAAKAAYNKSVQAKATADAAQESIDNLEIGGRNYLRAEPKSHSASAYGAYDLYVTEPLEAGQTYTIQLWNVDVSHSGKTAAQLGVNVYYCGSSVNWSGWIGTNYFTDGHADHLTLSFTPTEAQISHSNVTNTEKKFIRLYNSVPSATGTMSMTVGGWKLEKGNRATDWTPAPEDLQADIDTLQPELIVGTHGTTATATWTGTSTVLTEIKAGTRIQYKLSSAGASNVTLNLTLKGGTTTGAKPVYFLNTTRLGTQYDVNAIVDLIYDGSAWRVLNPYTNSNTVGTYGGAVKAGANGVKNYSLVMRDTATTWVSLTTTAGTGATKSRYTGKLYPDKVMYMGSNAAYTSGATTGTCYEALAINLQYSTNCGSTLVAGRAVYLVGTLDSDGLFTLDATWWTQTIPTTEDGKTYIYLGLAYSTTNIYLVPDNPMYQYYEGAFRTLREIEEMEAAKVANNYLAMDNTGIMVADMSGGTQYTPSNIPAGVKNAFIDEDSFNVRDGQDVLASFGETSHIGKLGEAHLEQTATGVDVVDSNGTNKVSFGAQSEVTVWEEESHMVAGYISDGGTIVNASTEFSLPAELAASQNMTLTIGSSSYTIPTGQTYSYTGSNYSIAYDGSRSVVVTNLSSSTITAVLRYPATQPTDYGITAVTTANTRIKARAYANGSLLAEGGIYANSAGNFGLYDAKHAKWLISSDAGGNVNVPSLAPKLLYASKVGAPSSQNVWNYMDIQLKQWAVIAIRAVVQNCMQYLIFFTGAPGNQYISDRPADVYIRGGFKVDWDAGRIYVRWVNGNSTTYQNVYFDRVYGLIRK